MQRFANNQPIEIFNRTLVGIDRKYRTIFPIQAANGTFAANNDRGAFYEGLIMKARNPPRAVNSHPSRPTRSSG